jgi:nitroimidazol reductase NimA-like FMN-containing flavoprotein (pyridoxamine 5'-phosphate oxidase superfamily)
MSEQSGLEAKGYGSGAESAADATSTRAYVDARGTGADASTAGAEGRAAFEPTDRTKLRRLAYRGTYDRETVYSILDEGFVCHVAFSVNGRPFLIPTAYARQGDRLVVHGSSSNHMLRALIAGAEACVTVTLVDGLVIARSAFHHSINYRSVVLFAKGTEVTEPAEKMRALRDIVEHLVPGRWAETREPSHDEMTMTKIVALPITEVSAKVRTGPPLDDEPDYALPHWAGVLPLQTALGTPEACPRLTSGIAIPATVGSYRRPGR